MMQKREVQMLPGVLQKGFILLTGLLLICTAFIVLSEPVEAATEGDYTYVVTATGTAEITKYNGSSIGLTIPTTLGGLPVTSVVGTFTNNYTIAGVVIPEGVTNLGDNVFFGCRELVSVTLPQSLTTIGNQTFYGCTRLTSIKIPSGVTNIGYSAFYNMTRLTTINIPEGVTELKSYAFYSCTALTNIILPQSLTSIGNEVFHYCNKLSTMVVPNNVTSIGNSVFNGCSVLKSITLSQNLTTLGTGVFYSCVNLTNVVIPSGVTIINDDLFYNCTRMTSVSLPSNITSIGRNSFRNCPVLASIVLPDAVTSIGITAFYGCAKISRLNIPSNLTVIDNTAFRGCVALTVFDVAANNPVYSGQNGMIYDKTGTTLVRCPTGVVGLITVPTGVTKIDNYAFYYCSRITKVVVPDGVTQIGEYAICACDALTTIVLPDSLSIIGRMAFCDNIKLSVINLPNGLTEIPAYMLNYCPLLTNIVIPESVTYIAPSAFRNSGLTSLIVPKSVVTLDYYALTGINTLAWVRFESPDTKIMDAYPNASPKKIIGGDPSTANDFAIARKILFEAIVMPEPEKPEKKAIYVLPGFMGSELYDTNGNLVFMDVGSLGLDITLSMDGLLISKFTRSDTGESLSDPSHQLSVNQNVDDYGVNNTYQNLVTQLRVNSVAQNGYDNVVFFPYDFLGDLNYSEQKLEDSINAGGYTNVTFVTHSTGGLLASAYVAKNNQKCMVKIDHNILIAAPLFGTYDSYNAIATGRHKVLNSQITDLGAVMVRPWVKNTLRNAPTAYQLFPSDEYLRQFPVLLEHDYQNILSTPQSFSSVDALSDVLITGNDSNFNFGLFGDLSNVRSFKTFREKSLENNIVSLLQSENTVLVGSSECNDSTLSKAVYQIDAFGKIFMSDLLYSDAGDSTVPSYSAFAGFDPINYNMVNYTTDGIKCADFKNYKYAHTELAQKDEIISYVIKEINGENTPSDYGVIANNNLSGLQMRLLSNSGSDMSDMIKFNITCDVPFDIKVTDSNNNIVVSVIDGVVTGFSGQSYIYDELESDGINNRSLFYTPNNGGIHVCVYRRVIDGTTVSLSGDVSTLDSDGNKTATASYTSSGVGDNEGLIGAFDLSSPVYLSNLGGLVINQIVTPVTKPTSWDIELPTNMNINETINVVVTGLDSTVVQSMLNWSTSDSSVVTVSNTGVLTAVGYGDAFIYANSGSKVVSRKIIVKCLATNVFVADITIVENSSMLIKPVFTPEKITDMATSYSTSDDTVALVDCNGRVVSKKPGVATIIYTTENGVSGSFVVTVITKSLVYLESISIITPADKLVYKVGETFDITGLVVSGTHTDGSVSTKLLTTRNITGFDSSKVAVDQIITITVNSKKVTYLIQIVAN